MACGLPPQPLVVAVGEDTLCPLLLVASCIICKSDGEPVYMAADYVDGAFGMWCLHCELLELDWWAALCCLLVDGTFWHITSCIVWLL